MSDVIESFRSAMYAGGIDYGGPIRPDGKLHRVKAAGDQAPNSWYVLHVDGKGSAGAYGCWKRNLRATWSDDSDTLTADQRRRIHAELDRATRERMREEERRRQQARRMAVWIWGQAQPAERHPYLERKGVKMVPRPSGIPRLPGGAASQPQGRVALAPVH